MIGRTIRAALALILLSFATGCDYRPFAIIIDGFDEYQVQGVNLWRLNEKTERYEREASIVFDRAAANWSGLQGEIIAYSSSSGGLELPAEVERDPTDPDRVTLRLSYFVAAPGVFRAALFNEVGESSLSSDAITL